MLITHDHPAVIDQIFVEDHNFFITHLHSVPALILVVLSSYMHTISIGDVALQKAGRGAACSF